ncbi:hypothetical protein MATL_G00082060 [Megalops atlanticus]|uniref:Uncharacterized protein n=1 Tax=Megalops atlanticus TaxID=7932 RepID=A0A9D3T704_MEGAT|nr:hypothetical protein MATL_G00082060 [Megalops atlanticus]
MWRDALAVPPQVSALTFYRYEQPIADYCQAHQSLQLNMGLEGSAPGLEGLQNPVPRDRAVVQTVAIPTGPATTRTLPRTTAAATGEGPSSSFPPPERSMLTFGR